MAYEHNNQSNGSEGYGSYSYNGKDEYYLNNYRGSGGGGYRGSRGRVSRGNNYYGNSYRGGSSRGGGGYYKSYNNNYYGGRGGGHRSYSIIMIKEMIQQVRQQRHHKMENTNLKIIHKKLNIHIHHDLIFLDSIVVHIEVGLEEVIEDVAVAVSIMD